MVKKIISIRKNCSRPQKRNSGLQKILDHFCPLRHSIWKAILGKSGRVFLGRSRIFSDGREFSRTVENFLGRSRIFSDGREFSRTIENFLGRSRIFSDGREFSRTVEILNFLRQSRMRNSYN